MSANFRGVAQSFTSCGFSSPINILNTPVFVIVDDVDVSVFLLNFMPNFNKMSSRILCLVFGISEYLELVILSHSFLITDTLIVEPVDLSDYVISKPSLSKITLMMSNLVKRRMNRLCCLGFCFINQSR